ncbi:hypothetical protein Poly51_11850 [Rubripirellula tenax]|uniref:Uncharacterized protein n=1 Tax=Rubripirellula tenax TaxID=2528015 RepID=A0A5C6FJZ7_9BACT|nr:hypothetical protein [Rubripirellula tenax]TWU60903.1 hypothetical protein Poly51_11850 [Rubripirellula tenax]
MNLWVTYLRLIGSSLLLLTAVATYRDLVDDQAESLAYYASRLTLMPLLGIGLYVRNRWIVRLVYGLAIPTAMILWIGAAFFGPPIAISQFIALSGLLFGLGVLVLVPRDTLTGYSPFAQGDSTVRPSETGNPYQPSATLLESTTDTVQDGG